MQTSTKEHFQNLLKALQIEKQEELDDYKLLTDTNDFSKRIEEGITLYPIEFTELKFNDFGDQLIEVKTNPNQEGSSFKSGKIVEVFNSDGASVQGQITFYRDNVIIIKCGDEEIEDWIKKGKVGLNALVDTKTYDAFEQAIRTILDSEKDNLPVRFYESSKSFQADPSYQSESLNDAQNKAVNELLSDNEVSIIHGPPGTGKTTTLVAGIKKLTQNGKSVLVCAPSNAAVDNISIQLLNDKVNVVRIGNENKIDVKVKPAYLETKIKNDSSFKFLQQLKNQSDDLRKKAFKYKRNFGKEEYQERKALKQELKSLRSDIRTIQKDISKNILEKAEVICGTFFSIQQFNLPQDSYDYLIIDEAGQAIEPAIWSVAHLGDKMVLAGDDLQLPPTVKSRTAEKMGLAKSVLERAAEIDKPRTLLNVQYRMNDTIMAFSNSQFYQNQLIAHESVAHQKIENNDFEAVEFIDTAGCGYEEIKEPNGGGISNPGEVGVIEKVLQELQIQTVNQSVGIITPYRSQLNEIHHNIENIDCNTVDSFQGQERDIIIISLVRSNENGEIGFLSDYRRMNVAMTRAKKKLIVIGDSATLGQDKFYNDFLDFVEQKGSYRTAWEFAT
ncbi:MAG: AAA domain-containing protein [Crocinitomicaceae bacterium]